VLNLFLGLRLPLRISASSAPLRYLFSFFNSLTLELFPSYTLLVFRPRTVDSEPALYDAAIKILSRRPHSVSEMKKALIRRTADEDLIQKVLARLKQNGLIDDARYAKQFARQRTEIRHQGKYRVARELRARGVPDHHIETAVAEAAANSDEAAMVRQRIDRKLRLFRGPNANKLIDDRKIASLYRTLLRAGFSSDTIRRELKRATAEDLPEIDSPDEP
jgi:regulatory protein